MSSYFQAIIKRSNKINQGNALGIFLIMPSKSLLLTSAPERIEKVSTNSVIDSSPYRAINLHMIRRLFD